jgi:hypothetical protein
VGLGAAWLVRASTYWPRGINEWAGPPCQ